MSSHLEWQNLVAWLQDNGMNVGKDSLLVECHDFPDTGRGLAVTRDTKANEILFTIPKKCLLNMDALRDWSHEVGISRLTATQTLAAFLATYRDKHIDSDLIQFYKPYMDSLPQNFDFHPLTWVMNNHAAEMKELVATIPLRMVKRMLDMQNRFREDFFNAQSSIPRITIENFLWGWLNVNTRSLYYKCKGAASHQDNITMCPLLDFANHSFSAPNFNTPLHRSKGHPIPSMVAPPASGLRAGQQVFLLYGFHSNEVMFMEYGFTDPNAPKEVCIDGVVEALFKEAEDGVQKRALLEARNYWGDWALHSEPSPAHPSYRLIPALRLLHIPLGDEDMIRRWDRTVVGTLDEVSHENTEKLQSTLTNLCENYHSEAVLYLSRNLNGGNLAEQWKRHGMTSIQLICKEQRDVAALVMESLTSGIEF